MDTNDLRSAVTVISLVLFVALVAWTWSRRRRTAFDEAAQLPFVEEHVAPVAGRPHNEERNTP
ncbi:MAG: cbb3-type cytochrome c oxidase subunit 3 [Rubrivivax sp.]